MEGFYNPKVVNPRDFTVSLLSKIQSLVLVVNRYLISLKYDTCCQDLKLIQTLYYINLVDVFSNIEHGILKKSKLVHSEICIKIQYIGQLLSEMAHDLRLPPYNINYTVLAMFRQNLRDM
jgi:hypothetical protein